MQRSIIIGTLALCLAVAGGFFLASRTDPGEPPVPAGAADQTEPPPPAAAPAAETFPADPGASRNPPPSQSVAGPMSLAFPPATAEEPPPAVQKRIEELEDLGTMDDPASLKAILAEVQNPDARIRNAALDAAIQFGSRDAIPALAEAAAASTDAGEKKELLDAIEFLKLPSLTEYLQRQGNTGRPVIVRPAGGSVSKRFTPGGDAAQRR